MDEQRIRAKKISVNHDTKAKTYELRVIEKGTNKHFIVEMGSAQALLVVDAFGVDEVRMEG